MEDKVNLEHALGQFSEPWRPRIIAEVNGSKVQVAKFHGDHTWHAHDDSDDFFLVLKGKMFLDLPDQTLEMGPGDLYVVPAGMKHRPRTEAEAHILNIELMGTVSTGDADESVLTAPEQRL